MGYEEQRGLRERLGLGDVVSVLQQSGLRWYGHAEVEGEGQWLGDMWSLQWGCQTGEDMDRGCAEGLARA